MAGGPDNMRWFWSLYGVVGRPPKVHMNGDAATLDEAKAHNEEALSDAFVRRTNPENSARA